MPQEEGSRHSTNVIPALKHERDQGVSSLVSKSPQSLERSDVALRVLVPGLRISAADCIRLGGYVLAEFSS
jgi:hypothetical protein